MCYKFKFFFSRLFSNLFFKNLKSTFQIYVKQFFVYSSVEMYREESLLIKHKEILTENHKNHFYKEKQLVKRRLYDIA